MKKIPLSWKIGIFFFSLLFSFFIFLPVARAQSKQLSGLWKSSSGVTIEIGDTGNGIKGVAKKSEDVADIGRSFIDGSITGNIFKGEVYLKALARNCSHLDGWYPATGEVSADGNTITAHWKESKYNVETCAFTGNIDQGTITYTRISPQASPSSNPTAVPTITLQPTYVSTSGRNSTLRRDIPGYSQALVTDPPKVSDFPKIPQSDFKVVYPASTPSANIKDSIFIGKVGDTGEVVVEFPNGEKITLTDDMSGIDFFNRRFGVTLPGSQMGNPTQLMIREIDCHLIISDRSCEAIYDRCRYGDIWDAQTRITKTIGDCNYLNDVGSARVLVEKGNATFKTPGGVVVTGSQADFGIGYNTQSGTSIIEVYNGSVKVSNKSGQSKTISAVYGSQINQIEVDKDGVMTETIAIPESQWEAFLASQQKKTESETNGNVLPVLVVIVVLGLGGAGVFLYRTGKLIPFYKNYIEKIFNMAKKKDEKK